MMITDTKSLVNRWGFRTRHACQICDLSRASIADSLANAPMGSDDRLQAIMIAEGCPRCRKVMRSWWCRFGRRRRWGGRP